MGVSIDLVSFLQSDGQVYKYHHDEGEMKSMNNYCACSNSGIKVYSNENFHE